MNLMCFQPNRYDREILLCNHYTVHGCTAFHVTIMYTPDGERKNHLIQWMEKFTNFTDLVRRLLISMHAGHEASIEKKKKIDDSYKEFLEKMDGDSEEKYLRQYISEMKAIYAIFQKSVACKPNL